MKRWTAFTLVAVVSAVVVTALVVRSRFERDISIAAERAAQGSTMVDTHCIRTLSAPVIVV